MIRLARWLPSLLGLLAACRLCAAEPEPVRLRVIDDAGALLSQAQGLLVCPDPPSCEACILGDDGALLLPPRRAVNASADCQVLVRARGFALWRSPLAPLGRSETEIVLSRGRRLELVLRAADGRALPDTLAPIVVDGDLLPLAWEGRCDPAGPDPGYAVDKYGSRSFLVSAPAQDANLFLLVDEPGFLRGFQAGPVTDSMISTGSLEIPLPAPATIRCRIETSTKPLEGGELRLEVRRHVVLAGGSRTSFLLESRVLDPTTMEVRFADLAPGTYSFTLVGGPFGVAPSRASHRKIDVNSASAYELVLSPS